MKLPLALVLVLTACATPSTDKVGDPDTSEAVCDRIHGANGVMLLIDQQTHFSTSAPDTTTRTTSLAGPMDDGTYLAVAGGELLASTDGGCNWSEPGSRLPATGDWDLVTQGATAYAFDRASAATATSTDGALSWTASDSGEPFLGPVAADAAVSGRLRGVQVRGVVTSEDAGATWNVASGTPPAALLSGAVYPGDLQIAAGTWSGGVLLTRTGGETWEEVGGELIERGLVPGTITFSTESPDAMWVLGTQGADVYLYSTVDGGTNWTDVTSSKAIDIEADAALYAIPGVLNGVAAAWGSSEDNYGINLYEILAGDNTHTTHTSAYFHVHDIHFRQDGGWMIGVDGIP